MPPNNDPIFELTPVVWPGLTSTTSQAALQGNALTNGTVLGTGGTNGTKVDEIRATATGTSFVGTVNIFLVDASSNWWLIDQVPIVAQTLTTGTPQQLWDRQYPNLVVPSGWELAVTQTCAGAQVAVAVVALGGSF